MNWEYIDGAGHWQVTCPRCDAVYTTTSIADAYKRGRQHERGCTA